MRAPLLAALEQAAVIEEDVNELPEQVVGGLDNLLGDEPILPRGREAPLRGIRTACHARGKGDRH